MRPGDEIRGCAVWCCPSACRDPQRALANVLKPEPSARPVGSGDGVLFDHRAATDVEGASLSIDVGRLAMVSGITSPRPSLADRRCICAPGKSSSGVVYCRFGNDFAPAGRCPQRLGYGDLPCGRARPC